MAIPAVVDDAAGSTTSPGAFTVALPSGTSYLAVTSAKRTSTGEPVVPPAGWTLVPNTDQWEDESRIWNRGATYHANATDSPGTSWSLASGGEGAQVVIIGFDSSTTVDASNSNTSNTSPTVTASEAVLVVRPFSTNAFNATPPVVNYPAGSDGGVQAYVPSNSADDGNLAAFAWADQGSGGSTGTAAWSMSAGETFESISATVALVAAGGEVPAEGSAAFGVGVELAAAGQAPVVGASGTAALGIGLELAAVGARPSAGAAALALGLGLAATGSDGGGPEAIIVSAVTGPRRVLVTTSGPRTRRTSTGAATRRSATGPATSRTITGAET